jgi:hypothetical protein
MGKLTKGGVRSMSMTKTKKEFLAELDQERREIEKEFEGAEPVEVIFAPNLKIRHISDEEAEKLRLPPEADDGAEGAPERCG